MPTVPNSDSALHPRTDQMTEANDDQLPTRRIRPGTSVSIQHDNRVKVGEEEEEKRSMNL